MLVPIERATAPACTAAAVELRLPGRAPLLLVERSAGVRVQPRSLAYPAGGSLVTIGSLRLVGSCSRTRQARGSVEIHSLSLFGGAVTADVVSIDVHGGTRSQRIRFRGLRVGGRAVADRARVVALGRWASVVLARSHALGAEPTERGARPLLSASALVIHLLEPRAGLPSGASMRVAFVEVRAPTAAARRGARQTRAGSRHARARIGKRPGPRIHRPPKVTPPRIHRALKVTPRLGLRRYVFPVAGAATFWDSYGAFRPDVPGNWHHGDDIFAPVGTPVVAVASGTVNRVGWEVLGGWRLWVRDRLRNEFYYAHLSGYSPLPLGSKRVKAGQVLGFVGNTGDAFTTPFHLHFEIHPHQLLHLNYDGAVDPTGYLQHWRHVKIVRAPKPLLPRSLPVGDLRREARFVFGELLAARGLTHDRPSSPPRIRLPGVDVAVRPFTAALRTSPPRHGSTRVGLVVALALLGLALSVVLGGGTTVLLKRRRRREGTFTHA